MFYKTTLFWLLTLGLVSMTPAYANISADTLTEEQDKQALSVDQSAEAKQNQSSTYRLPDALKRILVPGISVSQQFSAQSGLTGWVLSREDNHTLVYTTADGKTLITGTLLDHKGNNLSEFYTKRYLPEADFALLAQAYSIAQKSELQEHKAKSQGAGGSDNSVLYVFFDPNCPYCQFAWQALEVYQQQGAEIRWIPVAYLQPDSRIKATTLLQSEQPEHSLRAVMMQQEILPMPEEGIGIESEQALSFNMQLMKRFALQGTPAFVWLDSEQQLQSYSGMPKLATFAEMTGQEEQPQKAPELARFR